MSLGISTTPHSKCIPRSSWPTQHELHRLLWTLYFILFCLYSRFPAGSCQGLELFFGHSAFLWPVSGERDLRTHAPVFPPDISSMALTWALLSPGLVSPDLFFSFQHLLLNCSGLPEAWHLQPACACCLSLRLF